MSINAVLNVKKFVRAGRAQILGCLLYKARMVHLASARILCRIL